MWEQLQSWLNWDMSKKDEDEWRLGLQGLGEETYNKIAMNNFDNPVYKSMLSTEKSRRMGKRQKLFDVAAEGGAKHGGTAVAGGGTTGVSYTDPYPGDPTDRFPKSITEEEEKQRLALRAPGFATFGYNSWT